jgi:hypothetical protein
MHPVVDVGQPHSTGYEVTNHGGQHHRLSPIPAIGCAYPTKRDVINSLLPSPIHKNIPNYGFLFV